MEQFYRFQEPEEEITQNNSGGFEIENAERRLKRLCKLNADIESRSGSHSNRSSLSTNRTPHEYERAFSILGLSVGLLTPFSIFLKIILESNRVEPAMVLMLALTTNAGAIAGFFSGKIVGRIHRELEKFSWPMMGIALPFVGATWGIFAGGTSGAFAMLFGAIPGAVIGALVGAFALVVFGMGFRTIAEIQGDIRTGQYLPMAFGLSLVIAALVLGS